MKKGKIGNYHCLWLSSFFNHVYKFGGGFPHGSDSKESTCNMGDLGSIPGLGRSLGGGYGNPLQYSCLKNPHGQRSLADYSQQGCKESWHDRMTKNIYFLMKKNLIYMLKRRVEGNLRKYVLKSGKMCFEFNGNRTKCDMALFKKYEKLNNRTSLVAQTVKRLSTMQETWVQSLVWEDPNVICL